MCRGTLLQRRCARQGQRNDHHKSYEYRHATGNQHDLAEQVRFHQVIFSHCLFSCAALDAGNQLYVARTKTYEMLAL